MDAEYSIYSSPHFGGFRRKLLYGKPYPLCLEVWKILLKKYLQIVISILYNYKDKI